MEQELVIQKTTDFVKAVLSDAEGGHDWWHIFRVRNLAIKMYPQLATVKWEYNWGGLVAITLDREPHIFQLGPNAYAGLGYNGRGVPMATMMGKQLTDLVCGEDIPMPVQPIKPIPVHRFSQIGISFHIVISRLLDSIL